MTLDAVADESRKKMADVVARSPVWLCSIDGKICYYGDALSTMLRLPALVPCFILFVFLFYAFFFFPAPRYVYLLRVSSSVQQPSATLSKYVRILEYVFFLLVSFVPYPISELFSFLFIFLL